MKWRYLKRVIVAAAVSLSVAACTGNVDGSAKPDPAPSPSSAANTSNPLSGIAPCTTLDQVVSGQGFSPAVPTVADSEHSCRVHKDVQGATPALDISLSLHDGQNYKANIRNPSQASSGSVGPRAAIEEAEPLNVKGDCDVSLEVKPNSKATVGVSTDTTDNACKTAESLAEKLEPLLPKNT
ncbi:DUF3558 family protein [Amycolatopsis carbonis]|uniref:DUF3558 family protein n=1 Tax=Amycolatopsis carbonis TaxID=715471 RepID=A0A9Y2MZW8_9PSEU|nr:DUF3558 family protein [Amycolatopsis sp. 2-15]WIX81519.1 DUF3558 family protein [Amycolatopsis sp. 2-15]